MNERILIVEDQFIEANNLKMILERTGYQVCSIARSVPLALQIIEKENPDLVLLDIYLQGPLTGIDLAKTLNEKNIAFVYLSANSNKETLDAAKATQPYGFLVKPFREKDVLVTLDIARYLHEHSLESRLRAQQRAGSASPAGSALAAGSVESAGSVGSAGPMDPAGKKGSAPDRTAAGRKDAGAGTMAGAPTGGPAALAGFQGIIGSSKGLLTVLDHLMVVAPLETSVLILGESGTGKERIADCIHHFSPRRPKPLIKVNCAALPASLIESELFGHERGAFTGATEKRQGKFEQAEGGTLFLDEIGELPFDLQVKLLRVLQEREIERIGGSHTIKINVRIIAATNRNLEKEVAEGRFRIDLYYRLNVFPLTLPPLRERKEDIPVLARHFADIYSRKSGKNITGLSDKAIEDMMTYSWPGNIRELEHLIERSVLLTKGTLINELPLPRSNREPAAPAGDKERVKSIDEIERDHILAVLKQCNGKISGKGGAAELLNLNVSTLNSKIKKLGIEKDRFFSAR